ncbi:GyrI-like domain-containing protein [Gorillibacterium sp. sgz5001074]|uniref:GyrI-like domain-containing protein n=1 Tax=Gorillibacterium sp. sgz5001074 TaxID=3446695 RepID=UPI003F6805F8
MPEVLKAYTQAVPELRFVGKKYGEEDRVNGGFGQQWGEWLQNGWFQVIERQAGGPERLRSLYEDGDAYIGLMRWKDGEPFQYWIGMFVSPDCEAPAGYESVDFPASILGVCWLHGMEPDIYGKEELCAWELTELGYTIAKDGDQAYWFFERYACPRFTDKDEEGKVILDICHYVKS